MLVLFNFEYIIYLILEKIHYDIVVKGKVQGVWFRKYTKEKADELHINGFVQNKFDNTVFIEAEGTETAMKKFIELLSVGSPLSKVQDIVFDNCIEFQGYTDFEIRRTTI